MTAARGSQPWWTLTSSLAAYAGQTITLRISSSHTNQYRSWFHVDDVEWSRQTATITNANVQAFGVNVTAPNDTAVTTPSQYQVAQTLTIRAQSQATTSAVRADVINPSGTVVATGVILYDDGTHGDAAAGDRIFTNNGSVPANPTYTFGAGDAQSASLAGARLRARRARPARSARPTATCTSPARRTRRRTRRTSGTSTTRSSRS